MNGLHYKLTVLKQERRNWEYPIRYVQFVFRSEIGAKTAIEFRTEELSGKHKFVSTFPYLRDFGQPGNQTLKLVCINEYV